MQIIFATGGTCHLIERSRKCATLHPYANMYSEEVDGLNKFLLIAHFHVLILHAGTIKSNKVFQGGSLRLLVALKEFYHWLMLIPSRPGTLVDIL